MSEGERKPTPRNMSPDLRPLTIFQIYRAYSEENTIQTWSGKHGERESHIDASSDESCNEMREHRWKGRQNEIIKLWNRPRVIERYPTKLFHPDTHGYRWEDGQDDLNSEWTFQLKFPYH
ncbi:hypothetical protein YC2023_066888 [Brassica napus]